MIGNIKVEQYGYIINSYEVKNKNDIKIKLDKILYLYNRNKNIYSTYYIYFEDLSNNVFSWQNIIKNNN